MKPVLPWRRHRLLASVALLGASAAVVASTVGPATAAPARGHAPSYQRADDAVGQWPISFRVRNVNRSKVPCASDGKTYTVRGHLVGPASAIRYGHRQDPVTLYLHGLSFGQFFWRFRDVRGYDYATNQARHGQTSVVIDRLGYGASDKLPGKQICVGSRADIAHQMVSQLRSGQYRLDGASRPRFDKVVLAGHSYGGQIAQVEAYSFGDIDGLIVVSYTDVGRSALLASNGAYAAKICARGGMPVAPGGPGGYAPFGPPAKAAQALFHTVDPRVLAAALPKLTLDPCGDTASFTKATRIDLANVRRIHVPVLLVGGGSDALFPPPALQRQAALYTGTRELNVVTLPATAHAVTLERTHHQFERAVRSWVRDHVGRSRGGWCDCGDD